MSLKSKMLNLRVLRDSRHLKNVGWNSRSFSEVKIKKKRESAVAT